MLTRESRGGVSRREERGQVKGAWITIREELGMDLTEESGPLDEGKSKRLPSILGCFKVVEADQ